MWCWEFKSGVVCSFSVRILWYAEPPLCSCKTGKWPTWSGWKENSATPTPHRGGCRGRSSTKCLWLIHLWMCTEKEIIFVHTRQNLVVALHIFVFFSVFVAQKKSFHVIKSVLIPVFSDQTLLSWTYTPWCSFTEWVVFFLASDWPLYEMVDL